MLEIRNNCFILLFIVGITLVSGQVLAQNRASRKASYQYTMEPRSARIDRLNDLRFISSDSVREAVSFRDPAGRPLIDTRFRVKDSKDIATIHLYDSRGVEAIGYLPFAVLSDTGYLSSMDSVQAAFYANSSTEGIVTDAKPYSTTTYEVSPLKRVMEVTEPGADWYSHGKKTIYNYRVNNANEVRNFVPTAAWVYRGNTNYAAGTLNVIDMTNTEGVVVSKFTDQQGRTMLIKQGSLQTYYLYDSLGRLAYVLPPKAVESLPSVSYTVGPKVNALAQFFYRYVYDSKSRLIEKYIPGRGKEEYVYDMLGRVVMSRDSNLRASGKWRFIKYDPLGRKAYWGIVSLASERRIVQGIVDGRTKTHEIFDWGTKCYSLANTYPTVTANDIYEEYVYDNYFPDRAINATEMDDLGVTSETGSAKGLLTRFRSRVLETTTWVENWYFYNADGQLLQSIRKNAANGSSEQYNSFKYDFTGQVLTSRFTHYSGGVAKVTVKYYYTYTADGQVQTIDVEIPGGLTRNQIASYEYNSLGELTRKNLGKNGTTYLQQIDYQYNLRGWLTAINDVNATSSGDLFCMTLHYQDGLTALGGAARYDGMLTGMEWRVNHTTTGNAKMGYGYAYDTCGRLQQGTYGSGSALTTNKNRYDEAYTYDSNGNIATLVRKGEKATGTYGTLDNMTYGYTGNRLNNLADSEANTANTLSFRDVTGTGAEYTYDGNGNLKTDTNRGVTSTTYNILDQAQAVTVKQGGVTTSYTFTYTASGEKLKAVYASTTLYYDGPLTFSGSILSSISTPEGRINCSGYAGYAQEYMVTDNQGNVRVTFNKDASTGKAKLLNASHYYPSGLEINTFRVVGGAVNRFGYGAKEELGLPINMLDFHARMYDPTTVRWHVPDPLAEETAAVSPYAYCLGNPVNFIDPTGMSTTRPYDYWGTFLHSGDYVMAQDYGGGSGYYGGPGDSDNGTGLHGVYYDWITGTYRYVFTESIVNSLLIFSSDVESSFFGNEATIAYIGLMNWRKGEYSISIKDVPIGAPPSLLSTLSAMPFELPKQAPVGLPQSTGDAGKIMAGTLTLCGILLADDATVVGVADDPAIPVVLAIGASAALVVKMHQEIERILTKSPGPQGFVYELRARASGYYPNVRGGTTFLNAGEVWKIGETTQGFGRYSENYLNGIGPAGVQMIPIFPGNQVEIKVQEKIMLYGYFFMNGTLPPGNPIFR